MCSSLHTPTGDEYIEALRVRFMELGIWGVVGGEVSRIR